MKNSIQFIIVLISISAYSQSPWTQPKNGLYTQVSFTTIPNYDAIFSNSDQKLFGTYSDNTIQFFGEYGLSDQTSLVINLPFKLISVNDFKDPTVNCDENCDENYSNNSLGNIAFGIKHNFYKQKWLLSGQFSVEANTGSYDSVSGIRTGYDAWSFTPLFLAGKSFGKTYIQAFTGADIRTNGYSSNFKIGGEIGRKISKKIWLIGFLDISKSLNNGTINLPTENIQTALYVNNQEYGSFGFKGIGEFTEKFGVTAGFGGAFFGNNVAKQAAITFGVYHKF